MSSNELLLVILLVCEYGFYGQNCNMTCGWCVKGKEECHVVTGKCVNGCQKGYEGTTCAKGE